MAMDAVLQKYVSDNEIAGAVLLIRKDGQLVYDKAFGYADIRNKTSVTKKTMFRLASMTKPITAIAVMQLVEMGKIGLYQGVETYLPRFAGQKCCKENLLSAQYQPDPNNPLGDVREFLNVPLVPAQRPITVFDLLNHSSGLGMGTVGCTLAQKVARYGQTIQQRAEAYAQIPLDFQPGTASGYSSVVAFEVLAAIIEAVSGEDFEGYLENHIFKPMGITDITFRPNLEQQARIPRLYKYQQETGTLADVTQSDKHWERMNTLVTDYCSASTGLYGTVEDYEKIVQMLLDRGTFHGVRILKPETVDMMAGKGISHNSRTNPGVYWGLSMYVMEDPKYKDSGRTVGSYGWSGAFGTHFFIDPKNNLEMVLGVNRSNIGGAASAVALAMEHAIKEAFALE